MPKVYGASASPFVRKVRAVLAEKGIAYELDPVIPFNVSPEFKRISPLGKIPVYEDGGRTLPDSSVICAYLERAHPTPALYPKDPYDYGRALWFEEYADTALAGEIGAKIFFPLVVGPLFLGREPAERSAGHCAAGRGGGNCVRRNASKTRSGSQRRRPMSTCAPSVMT